MLTQPTWLHRYKQTTDMNQKGMIANTLIREMAVHGDAEEISVYNDYGTLGLGDCAVHNKEEHAEIKRLVYDADATRLGKADYDSVLERAVTAFLTHAKEEEDEQLPLIRQKLTPEENDVRTVVLVCVQIERLKFGPENRSCIFEGADDGSYPPAPLGTSDRRDRPEGCRHAGCLP